MAEQTNPRQLVVFTLGGEQYALPIGQVHEIIRYTQPRSVASRDYSIRGVLSLRGRIVPVYDLATRLGVSCEPGEQSKIVIVDTGSQTAGVIVDAVDEVLTGRRRAARGRPGRRVDACRVDREARRAARGAAGARDDLHRPGRRGGVIDRRGRA